MSVSYNHARQHQNTTFESTVTDESVDTVIVLLAAWLWLRGACTWLRDILRASGMFRNLSVFGHREILALMRVSRFLVASALGEPSSCRR